MARNLGRVAAGALLAGMLLMAAAGGTATAAPPSSKPEHVKPGGAAHHFMGYDVRPLSTRAAATTAASVAPFLTRPYWGRHAVNSIFDHCSPDYTTSDGKICDSDGNVAYASYGVDPTFPSGYATAPGSSTYVYYNGHNGWDLNLVYEQVLAAADGVVQLAGQDPYNPGFGQTITIDHQNGFTTRYAHMSQIYVSSGQAVARGQLIGISGNTGNSTGPHLHFGLYITSSWSAIDPWGWDGGWPDPTPDVGDVWFTGNPHDPIPDAPTGVTATPSGSGAVQVSWAPPAFDGGSGISSYTVQASPGGASVQVSGTATQATVTGLDFQTSYTFTVTAANGIGPGPASAPSNSVQPVAPTSLAYFAWYDNLSSQVGADNIHITNPSSTATAVVAIKGLGAQRDLTLPPATSQIVTYPPGSVGGPILVEVDSGPAVVATQRVEYGNSFNEIPATPVTAAASSLYLPWYDLASTGMTADNIHVVNPSPSQSSNVTITGPGTPITLSLGPGEEQWASWPQGTIGGPVHVSVTSGAPVIASQRVVYFDTFNETLAQPASAAAGDLFFSWFDHASPGMLNDNIHLVNPDPTADSQVTITGPGAAITVTVPHQGQTLTGWPYPTIGGPVHIHVTSGPGVLATQRVQYFGSFNEVAAAPGSSARADLWFSWFDNASPGMTNDNIHLINPDPTADAQVTIAGPGATRTVTVPHNGGVLVAWPAPTIGGPVHIHVTSGPGILATQRVEYQQSFNEVASG